MRVDYAEYIQSEAWRQRAEAAMQRAGYRCQICNRPAPRVILDVHHRTYERLGNENPEDLTVLCRGCHELYETNRRMPRLPPAQPVAPPSRAAAAADVVERPLPVNPVTVRTPFAPATEDHQRSTLQAYKPAAGLPIPSDKHYQLATDPQAKPSTHLDLLQTGAQANPTDHYSLLPTEAAGKSADTPGQAGMRPSRKTYRLSRRNQLSLVVIMAIIFVSIIRMVDLPRPAARPTVLATPPTVAPTVAPTVTSTSAANATAAVVTLAPTATLAPPSPTPPPTLTVTPTVILTVAPTPTRPRPTPTADATAPPSTAPAPANPVVTQTALVCGSPCSCSPVIRTIPQGAQVTVLDTIACPGGLWYQIGEQEWLAPGLVKVGP